MDSKVSQYARAREQREEKFDFSSQFDTRSRQRAELIEEAKDKARELGANAIVGVKLETNANAGMFCMCPRPWHNKSSLLPLTFLPFLQPPSKACMCSGTREWNWSSAALQSRRQKRRLPWLGRDREVLLSKYLLLYLFTTVGEFLLT